MTETLEQKVIQVIAQSRLVPVETIRPETTFEEMGMTSLDALAVIFDLEEAFKISVPNELAMSLRTVQPVIETVRPLMTGAGDGGVGPP